MQKLHCLLSVLLSGILNTVAAQLPDFSFRHYTIENGFPASSILQVAQDKPGFIWSLNDYGLIRFDGNNFRTYRPDNADSFSLPASKSYNFGKGRTDLLLVSYERGICYYDVNTGGFKKLVRENLLKTAPSTRPFANNNEIWFATQDKQLHRLDTKSGTLTSFAACENYVACVFVDSRKRVWVGTHNGLYRFDPQKNKYELYWQDTIHTLYGAGMVRDIIEDEKNTLWFAGTNSGIYSLDPVDRSLKFFDFTPVHWRKTKFYLISYLGLRTVNGVLYIIANSNDGLVFLNSITGKYSVTKHDPGNPHSLLSNNVNDVIYDNTGTIWLATLQGLSKSEKTLPGLRTVRIGLLKNEYVDDETYGSEIKAISQDPRNSTIWIGTASRGLWQYDGGKDSVIKQIPILNGQHQPVEISELYIDKSGRLWMGTSAGAAVYEPGTEQLQFLSQINAGKDRFATNEVTSNFMEDSQDNIWVGTRNGVSIYSQHLQFVKNIIEEWHDPAKVKIHYIYALHPKNEHQVWIISRMLKLFDLDSGSFVSKISKNQDKITIPSFFEGTDDGRGNFYFTGFSGIYVWQKQSDSFYLPHFNSLVNQNFSETFVDNRNRLWVASLGEGLLKINPGTDAITQFTVKNGLSTNMMNHLLWSQRKGPVFFITKDGFQYFYPDSVATDSQSAPLRITGINILEKRLKADYQLFSDSSLRISYRQNVISFEFSLLDYNYTEDISYQYKLDGFDKDWINARNHRSATYTNLDAGKYVFRVRAKNHDGIDAGQAIVKLRVVPPFWKTGWFITLGILIVLLLLYRWYMHLQQKYRSEKILNSFTASLYGQTTIEDMAWDIARNCISKLGFVDCIVYILDEEKNVLVQKAACGPKNPVQRKILNPIEISLGKGIVGSVAQSGVAEIIHDTSVDQRYIVDDMRRLSEISVPMVADGTVFGIIDSEHPEKNFFTGQHLYLLRKIADVCSLRISKYIMEDRLRSKIARDLHDEMGSTLTSINIISKVTLQQVDGNALMKTNLQKIKDHSSRMMESMSDMVWAINPANDTLEKIILRMKEHAAEMLEPAKINLHFSVDGALDNIKLNIAQRKDLYLIFKEAINNAVKYSEATEIHIHLGQENNNMKMRITDNGKGFEAEKIYSGNGVRNMHSRAVQMKALLKIQSSPGTGTIILLQLPIA